MLEKAKELYKKASKSYAYAKLRKELADIKDKVDGLGEYKIQQGDARYVILKDKMEALLKGFQNEYDIEDLSEIYADNPGLQIVQSMAMAPNESEPTTQEKIVQGTVKVVTVGVLIAGICTAAVIVLGPLVVAFMHHFYQWWDKVL